jgi:hypothetical protein
VEVDAGTNFQDIKVAVFKLGLETDEYRNGGADCLFSLNRHPAGAWKSVPGRGEVQLQVR